MNVTEQQDYLDAVRRALADLDPAARDELLEDLPEHLAEVAAEGEGSLAERLGPPEAYAAELRAASGLGEAAPAAARGLDDRVATAVVRVRGALAAADRRTGPILGYPRASEFLRMLRPGWWVVRGYLVAMLITFITTGYDFGLLPRLGGSTLAAVLMLIVCVVASIWLGRREVGLPPVPRAGIAFGGVFLILFGLVGFNKADRYGDDREPVMISNNPYEYVQDIYVYDANGNPLRDALLYDQDGNPIRLGDPYRCADSFTNQRIVAGDVVGYPYCPERAPYLIAPRPGLHSGRGEPLATPTPLEPTATATPAPTPPATPTPTPAPTG